jgi:hypothetical protein
MNLALALKIPDAIVGDEERAQRSIRIVRNDPPVPPIELCTPAIGTFGYQNILPRPRIAQLLRHMQVLISRNLSEFLTVFGEVIVQQMQRTESPADGPCKGRGKQNENSDGRRSTASQ